MRFDLCCHGMLYAMCAGRVAPTFSRDEIAEGKKIATAVMIDEVKCSFCPFCGTKVDIRIHMMPEIRDKIAREEAMDIEAAMLVPEKKEVE
ncbi:MAG: hypothetical protein IJX35_00380 [Candidatus Methanomethylophilaceae archaeon]|nr:hypothetical protein [Candidatus Methanomethylophilaceae archaeon]